MTTEHPKVYYPLLDGCRFLAAIAVVWLHIAGASSLERTKFLGRFAVPFFACAAVFLACDTAWRRPQTMVAQYFLSRVRRIYLVFLAWSFLYLLMRSASYALLEHKGLLKFNAREFFLDGIAIQLWFLPFIIVATTAAFSISRAARLMPAGRPFVAVLAVVAGIVAVNVSAPAWVQADYMARLSYEVLPVCFWGIALAVISMSEPPGAPGRETENAAAREPGAPHLMRTLLAVTGAFAFLAWLFLGWSMGRSTLWENLAGLGLMLLSLNQVSTRPVGLLAIAGSYAFGIYLAHALFVEGLQHILPKFGLRESGFRDLLIFALSAPGSCLVVFVLRRGGPRMAWLVS